MIVFFNGEYVPKDEVRITPDDRGFLFGDGIYEVVCHYGANFFRLREHMDRMRRSMEELEIDGFEKYGFKEVCYELIDRNEFDGARASVYLQVTRGAPAVRTHHYPLERVEPTVYAAAFRAKRKADPEVGVSMITTPDVRWGRCDIKSLNILANCMTQTRANQNGAFDAILIRDGIALESSAASFFAVIDGQVRTAPRSNHILPSVTRQTVLDLCADAGIPHREKNIHEEELAGAEEMFLGGTMLELMPIVSVDGNRVGDGKPGPMTRRIRELFEEEVRPLRL
jgi:D-alanine transaminase